MVKATEEQRNKKMRAVGWAIGAVAIALYLAAIYLGAGRA